MSVLIKGMEIPTSGDLTIVITSSGYVEDLSGNVIKGVEAIPVPPHGRLIDADALLARFEKEERACEEHGRDFSFSFKSGGEYCTEWWPVQQMLMDAPTVIPSDKEGET